MMNRILNVAGYTVIAGLIAAQRDADGTPLIDGWFGLGLALVLAVVGLLANALATGDRR